MLITSNNDNDGDDMDINLDNIEVTAVEVFDFMMCEQAKEDTLILVILYSVLVFGTYTIQLL